MPNHLCHFAIHADDCERAMSFYGGVFGWRFQPWGPPGFWRISTGQAGVEGALHQRAEQLEGGGMRGFECTIAVDDVRAAEALIAQHGGTIVMQAFQIDGVGSVLKFLDTEGNAVSVMQYLPGVYETLGVME